MKHRTNSGWVFVTPAVVLLGIVGLIPLISVINYSFFEIFVLDQRFWIGLEWYGDIIRSDRFWSNFGRSALFSALVLAIQIPLGIAIALCIPKGKFWVGVALALFVLPLLVPWTMIPSLWLGLLNPETGLLGCIMATFGWSSD